MLYYKTVYCILKIIIEYSTVNLVNSKNGNNINFLDAIYE